VRLRAPGAAQNQRVLDAMKGGGLPYRAWRRGPRPASWPTHRSGYGGRVGRLQRSARPGLTNAMTGIGEAMLDSVPIVGIITDSETRAPTPRMAGATAAANTQLIRPSSKADRVRHQAEDPRAISSRPTDTPSGQSPAVAVVIPFKYLTEVWDSTPGAPPYRSLRRGGVPSRRSA